MPFPDASRRRLPRVRSLDFGLRTHLNRWRDARGPTGCQVWTTPFGYFCKWGTSMYCGSVAKVRKEI